MNNINKYVMTMLINNKQNACKTALPLWKTFSYNAVIVFVLQSNSLFVTVCNGIIFDKT